MPERIDAVIAAGGGQCTEFPLYEVIFFLCVAVYVMRKTSFDHLIKNQLLMLSFRAMSNLCYVYLFQQLALLSTENEWSIYVEMDFIPLLEAIRSIFSATVL